METPQKDLTSQQKQLLPLKMQLYPSVEKRASGVVENPTAVDLIKGTFSTDGFQDGYGELDRVRTGDTRCSPHKSPRK